MPKSNFGSRKQTGDRSDVSSTLKQSDPKNRVAKGDMIPRQGWFLRQTAHARDNGYSMIMRFRDNSRLLWFFFPDEMTLYFLCQRSDEELVALYQNNATFQVGQEIRCFFRNDYKQQMAVIEVFDNKDTGKMYNDYLARCKREKQKNVKKRILPTKRKKLISADSEAMEVQARDRLMLTLGTGNTTSGVEPATSETRRTRLAISTASSVTNPSEPASLEILEARPSKTSEGDVSASEAFVPIGSSHDFSGFLLPAAAPAKTAVIDVPEPELPKGPLPGITASSSSVVDDSHLRERNHSSDAYQTPAKTAPSGATPNPGSLESAESSNFQPEFDGEDVAETELDDIQAAEDRILHTEDGNASSECGGAGLLPDGTSNKLSFESPVAGPKKRVSSAFSEQTEKRKLLGDRNDDFSVEVVDFLKGAETFDEDKLLGLVQLQEATLQQEKDKKRGLLQLLRERKLREKKPKSDSKKADPDWSFYDENIPKDQKSAWRRLVPSSKFKKGQLWVRIQEANLLYATAKHMPDYMAKFPWDVQFTNVDLANAVSNYEKGRGFSGYFKQHKKEWFAHLDLVKEKKRDDNKLNKKSPWHVKSPSKEEWFRELGKKWSSKISSGFKMTSVHSRDVFRSKGANCDEDHEDSVSGADSSNHDDSDEW